MFAVTGDSTDVTTYFKLTKTADGLEATGLTITDLDLQYVRSGAAPAAKVDATALAATDSAHADNKAIEVDGTDQPGVYRVDWPDAAFAAGAKEVILTVKHADCFTEDLRVLIDPPANVVKWLGTEPATPTTAGVPEVDVTYVNGEAASASTMTEETIRQEIDSNSTQLAAIKAKTDNLPSDPADASDIAAEFSTVNSTLSTITGYIDTEIATLVTNVASILAAVDTEVAAIKAKTDNLPSDPADESSLQAAIAGLDTLLDALTTAVATVDTNVDSLIAAVVTAAGEPGQGAPPASASLTDKVAYLYKWARNKTEQTSTERKHYADNGTTVDQKATVSDSDGTFTRGEMTSGA